MLPPAQPLNVLMEPCPASPLSFVLQEGLYRFTVTGRTAAGLSAEQDVTVVVDATPPVAVVLTQPPPVGSAFSSRVSGRVRVRSRSMGRGRPRG